MRTERPTCRECACIKVCEYFQNENGRNLDEVCPLCNWENYFVPKQEWISVEERLPNNDWGTHWKERKYYLVITAPSGLMSVATYGHKEFGWWVDRCSQILDEKTYRKVTHWMPLPMPPKGDDCK